MGRAILITAGLIVTLLGPLVYAGPQLASDLSVGQKWTLADDLAIREVKCTRWYFLVSTCHVDYINRRDPERVGGTLNYFVFGSWSGERARLLRSIDNPNQIGTTLGLEHMQQRLLSFGAFVVLALAVLIALLRRFMRTSRPAADVSRVQDELTAPVASVGTFGRRSSPTLS